jgi:hypothetical protein
MPTLLGVGLLSEDTRDEVSFALTDCREKIMSDIEHRNCRSFA